MSRLTIHERNTKYQPRHWIVMLFAVFFIAGSLFHSELPIAGASQANESYAGSGQDRETLFQEAHMPGRHAPGGKLPGQVHNQFADAAGCVLCGPVQTVDEARPKALLMPAAPAHQTGISSRTTVPPLRPPIFQV